MGTTLSPLSPVPSGKARQPLMDPRAESGANPDASEVATHFEGLFMSMMLKEMRSTLSDGLFSGDSSDTFGALFDLHMGQHMADRGGLGIGALVAAEYARNAA